MYYQRIRDLREDSDLFQKNIASLLGTSIQQYNKYELGIREIPLQHLVTLAVFYRTTSDYILGLTNKRSLPLHYSRPAHINYAICMVTLHRRIFLHRKRLGMKQSDIAQHLQTTQQVYSQYERGKKSLPCHHLKHLAQMFGVTSDYLLGLDGIQDDQLM